MLKVFEAFSGYGSQSIALERLGIEHKVVGISEIDKNAIKAYYALHSENIHNYGDISKIKPEELPEFDLFTYSFPCTNISLSGKVEGIVRGGNSSGLLYECERIIEYCRPKYLLMENVKPQFDEWLEYLESLGYKNQWFILDAKDFGVPQSRERVFCISILGEEPNLVIEKKDLNYTIFDFLDKKVDDSYIKYLSGHLKGVYKNGAIRGRYNEQGEIEQKLELRDDGLSNTITTVKKDNVLVMDGKVRYLTEKECFRLMGLTEEEILKISESGVSKSMQYKLAGNSIVVPVLEGIFDTLFNAMN